MKGLRLSDYENGIRNIGHLYNGSQVYKSEKTNDFDDWHWHCDCYSICQIRVSTKCAIRITYNYVCYMLRMDKTMKDLMGKFKFKVPEDSKHDDAGKSIEKTFEYVECESESEAIDYITKKEWNVTDMVNEKIKTNARSNAYQSATLVYKPTEVSQEDIIERMVRDYIRLGISEENARAQVTTMLSATKG